MHSSATTTTGTTATTVIYVFEGVSVGRGGTTGWSEPWPLISNFLPTAFVEIDSPRSVHALPRPAQLAELERLACAGRTRVSHRERARFGFCDAPRRPGYRAVRTR